MEQVGDPSELVLGADRQLERRDLVAERRDELIERALEVGALAVELVHEDRARQPRLDRELPGDLGLDLDAVDRRHDDDHGVDGPDRRAHVADEVGVAGGVEHVDLHAVPLDRGHRERDGDALPLLVRVVVADRVPVFDGAHPRDRAGGEQHRLEQGGLARPPVTDQQHVADVLRVVGLQRVSSSSRGWYGVRGPGIVPKERVATLARSSPMVRFERQPPGTALTRSILSVGAILAALAAWFVIARVPERGAIAALVSGALLLLGGHRANHGAGGPTDRMLDELLDRAWDGAVLGSMAWVARTDEPAVAVAALAALCAAPSPPTSVREVHRSATAWRRATSPVACTTRSWSPGSRSISPGCCGSRPACRRSRSGCARRRSRARSGRDVARSDRKRRLATRRHASRWRITCIDRWHGSLERSRSGWAGASSDSADALRSSSPRPRGRWSPRTWAPVLGRPPADPIVRAAARAGFEPTRGTGSRASASRR